MYLHVVMETTSFPPQSLLTGRHKSQLVQIGSHGLHFRDLNAGFFRNHEPADTHHIPRIYDATDDHCRGCRWPEGETADGPDSRNLWKRDILLEIAGFFQ